MDRTDRSQDHIPRVDPRWGYIRIHTDYGYLVIPRRPSPLASRDGQVGPRVGRPERRTGIAGTGRPV